MTSTFLLCYNRDASPYLDSRVLAFIKTHRLVQQWAFVFSGCYFLKSNSPLSSVDKTFTEFFEPTHYILSQISADPEETNGYINPEIWEWLPKDPTDPIGSIGDRSKEK